MSKIKTLETLRTAARNMAKGRNLEHHEECNLLLRIADEIEAEIAERFMELPVDADGVPIKPGDIMQFRDDAPVRVDSIGNSKCYVGDFGWFGGNGGFYGKGTLKCCRHAKPRTLEDVLDDFAARVLNSGHQWGLDAEETKSEYADEIRELLRGDAE